MGSAPECGGAAAFGRGRAPVRARLAAAGILAYTFALALAAATAHAAPSLQHDAVPPAPPDAAAGLTTYGARCAACHGPVGRGAGTAGLEAPPPSLADPAVVRRRSPAEAYDIVTNGRIENLMPPWREALSERERWDAVYGAWSFYYTPDRLARGRLAYEDACAACHGPAGGPGFAGEDVAGEDVAGADAAGAAVAVGTEGTRAALARGGPALAVRRNLDDPAWMASRSQDDLFAAARAAGEGHAPEDVTDDALHGALDYLRAGTFWSLPFGSLAPGGRIAGRVENGSDAAAGPAGARLRAVPWSAGSDGAPGGVPGEAVERTLDETGRFALDDLLVGPQVEYRLVVTHGGVDYVHPEAIRLSDGAPARDDVRLTVYDGAADAPLEVRTAHLVLSPDPASGLIRAAEVWRVRNPSGLARVSVDGSATLSFRLPAGAREIAIDDPRMRSGARIEGDRLIDTSPYPPGEREVVFAYDVPYFEPELSISRTVDVAAAELRVLVASDRATVDGPGLEPTGRTDMGGQAVVGAVARDLPAGASVRATIRDLPPPERLAEGALRPAPRPRIPLRVARWLGIALAAVGLVGAIGYPVLAGRRASSARGAALADARRRLVREIAALDDRLARGELAANDHAARRAALLDRAIAVARAEAAAHGTPPEEDRA